MTKTKKIIFYILLVIVTTVFLYTSYDKLSGDPMAKAGFAVAHLPVWFMYFIGVCELLGAIGLWIPKLRKWAVSGLLVIMAGALVTTVIFVSIPMAILPIVVAALLIIILKMDKKKALDSMPPAPSAPAPTI